MKRGQIYYIQRRDTIGAEIRKARPGVIVSNDAQNATSGVVTVVYLTTQPKEERSTHTTIHATGVASVVLCEQIDTVDKSLVGDYCGKCTPREMADIEVAIGKALGMVDDYGDALIDNTPDEALLIRNEELLYENNKLCEKLIELTNQRDRYEKIIDIMSLAVEL